MSVSASITRKLDNNYVQVDITSKKTEPHYYKVPELNADRFCKEFQKTDKQMSRLSDFSSIISTIAGCVIIGLITKKLGGAARMVLGILGGIAAGFGSTFVCSDIMNKKYDQMLAKYGAEEIDYDDKKQKLDKIL